MTQFIPHLLFFLGTLKKNLATPCSTWDLSPPTRDRIHTHYLRRWSLNHWATSEVAIPYLFHEVLLCVDYRKEVLASKWI